MTAKKQSVIQEETEFCPWTIQVLTADIKRKLGEVAKIVKGNAKKIIYSGMLLTIHEGKLIITGSNERVYVQCDVPLIGSTTKETHSILVDKKYFVNAVKNFEHDFMTLELIDPASLAIRYDRDNLYMRCVDSAEYIKEMEEIKVNEYIPIFEFKPSDLDAVKKEVGFAAAPKDFRKQLTGINLTSCAVKEIKKQNGKSKRNLGDKPGQQPVNPKLQETPKSYLIAAATDAYRLAKKEFKQIESEGIDITVPSEVFNFTKLFDKDTAIQAKMNNEFLILEGRNERVIARLFNENYPDIEKIFPESFSISTEFETTAIINRLKMIIDTISNNQVSVVKFSTSEDLHSFEVSGFSKEAGNISLNLQTVSYEGDPLAITFNANFMLDAIQSFGKVKTVKLDFISSKKPIRVTSPERPDQVCLVVPLRSH